MRRSKPANPASIASRMESAAKGGGKHRIDVPAVAPGFLDGSANA